MLIGKLATCWVQSWWHVVETFHMKNSQEDRSSKHVWKKLQDLHNKLWWVYVRIISMFCRGLSMKMRGTQHVYVDNVSLTWWQKKCFGWIHSGRPIGVQVTDQSYFSVSLSLSLSFPASLWLNQFRNAEEDESCRWGAWVICCPPWQNKMLIH